MFRPLTAAVWFTVLASSVFAQSCISLKGSVACPAFNASSISTDSNLIGLYPFLQNVTSTTDFDDQLRQYVNSTYVQTKYQQLLGCSNINLTNTSNYYARYTTTVICNAIVQNSVQPCQLSGAAAAAVCASSCAEFATSEEEITVNQQLCKTSTNYMPLIRADFTNCALPADSLTGNCIPAVGNEPDNCGFSSNLGGLCAYCATSSPNATDSCCAASGVTTRCVGVTLPSAVSSLPPLFTTTATATVTPGAAAANTNMNHGLSGGAIAGIVIGSVVAAILLVALLILLCACLRRRRGSQHGSVLNQPSPKRNGGSVAPVAFAGARGSPPAPGRVTRMTALEGGDAGFGQEKKDFDSDSDVFERFDAQPGDFAAAAGAAAAGKRPVTGRRAGSLSSFDMLNEGNESPTPGAVAQRDTGGFSSPENGNSTSQSEQLPFFKDYYSSDDIHPGDRVSVLWGYQPRAADEFELERGDTLKVVGIWDDGWATGVRVSERAEDWKPGKDRQRDSGVSNGSGVPEAQRARSPSPMPDGEVKAFPLVCVCLPQHWRKTIEGSDTSPSDG